MGFTDIWCFFKKGLQTRIGRKAERMESKSSKIWRAPHLCNEIPPPPILLVSCDFSSSPCQCQFSVPVTHTWDHRSSRSGKMFVWVTILEAAVCGQLSPCFQARGRQRGACGDRTPSHHDQKVEKRKVQNSGPAIPFEGMPPMPYPLQCPAFQTSYHLSINSI